MTLLPVRTNLIALTLALACLGLTAQAAGPLQLMPKELPAQSASQGGSKDVNAKEAIQKANAYLNSTPRFSADFVQTGADGARSDGKLVVERPGKMRFEYAPPAKLEIIADGRSVAVRDRKLKTQDLYFIGQTPLKFLLQDHIDLARDTSVQNVTQNANTTSILLIDKATFGGTSRISLTFDNKDFALKQWKVIDPQGYETLVKLSNIDTKSVPDPRLFTIDQQAYSRQ
ncbi:MAG: outer membrane lipoprotein carrier protein LolA [Hyphomicrobiales bacterium]|nr:outer membrane lipoprotein carrier protein LolA [Hyphomicrobiales bacterium]MDE2113364.1 outer-membrane lipoprotein carrier protein LolA [Hyphomicrobiales bacterium]